MDDTTGDARRALRRRLVGLFLFAFFLRAVGAWWGATYGDERPGVPAKVLTGDLIPPDHYYTPLLYYVHAVAYAAMFVLGRIAVAWHDAAGFRAFFFEFPQVFTVVCRWVVAALAAGAAPIAVLLAERLGVRGRWALLVGLVVALQPVNVLWGHVSKPQMPMTTAIFAMALASFHVLDRPDHRRPWVYLGLATAVAIAFKQTAAFFAVTMTAGLLLAQAVRGIDVPELLRRGALVTAVTVVAWIPLSIGVLLDLRNFLDYQTIQAAMSNRSAPIFEVLGTVVPMLGSTYDGATWVALGVAFAAPFLWPDPRVRLLFGSTFAALLVVVAIAATRVTPGLLLPFTGIFLFLGVCLLARWAESQQPAYRTGARVGLAVTALLVALGSADVVRQALARPISNQIGDIVRAQGGPDEVRILASWADRVGVPISFSAERAERARFERLCRKYGLEIPPEAPDRSTARARHFGGYFVLGFPWAVHGLEIYSDEDLEGKVRVSAWPVQPEEWRLEHWRSQGINLFVVEDSGLLETVPAYAAFVAELKEEAEVLARIESGRKRFFEEAHTVYRLPPTVTAPAD